MIKFRHFRSRLASTKCCAMGFKNYSVSTINYKVLLWKIHRCWILGWLKKSQSSISNSSERFCFTKTLILSKLAFKAFIMKSASLEFRKAEFLVFIYDSNETVYQNRRQFIWFEFKCICDLGHLCEKVCNLLHSEPCFPNTAKITRISIYIIGRTPWKDLLIVIIGDFEQ